MNTCVDEDTTENNERLYNNLIETENNGTNEIIGYDELNKDKINEDVVYEEFNEDKVNEYYEIQEYEKYITKDTEVTVQTDETMQEIIDKSEAHTEIFRDSLNSEVINNIHVSEEELKALESKQKELLDNLKKIHKENIVEEKITKSEPRVLKASKIYQEPTHKNIKKVGIKIIEKESKEPIKRGILSDIRKRKITTYKSSYEYFVDKYKYDSDFLIKLKEINDYVSSESYKGSTIMLEDELYNKNMIDDEMYIKFMREYLNRPIMSIEELMSRDVILDDFDEETCRSLRILELVSDDDSGRKIVVVSNKTVSAMSGTLHSKYEKLELYITLDKNIDIRLG